MNDQESFANARLTAYATDLFKILTENYVQKFPDKQIFLVLNTGRPAHYAWGVLEALSVVKQMRLFGLAESGGVILKKGISNGETSVAVENPTIWGELLIEIKNNLLGDISHSRKVHIEPKESMLSIKIAPRETTNWLHFDKQDKPISDKWIDEKVKEFLSNKSTALINEQKRLTQEIKTIPELSNIIINSLKSIGIDGLDNVFGSVDDLTSEKLSQVEDIFNTHARTEYQKLQEIKLTLKTLYLMSEKLVCDFNIKAGYVDIHHQDLNKYSTLQKTLQNNFNLKPSEVTFIAIGDSKTDIIPTDNTNIGEINDGADQVMFVAVRNSSPDVIEDVNKRMETRKGVFSLNESILGLISMTQGLIRLVQKNN